MAWFRRKALSQGPLEPLLSAPAIRFSQVSYSREEKLIFPGLSVRIDERRVGIIGDNGSGKSTFARLLNGLLLPDAGQVCIYGHNTAEETGRLSSLVGFLFQNPDHQILFPTVLEELCFGLMQLGRTQTEAEARAREYLISRDSQGWADRPAHSLSEGEKQRLCLWAVLLMEPKLLVLDETFASLDMRSRLRMMQELDAQQQQLLMITHDLELLQSFDRVLWLQNGEVQADGNAQVVIDAYRAYTRDNL